MRVSVRRWRNAIYSGRLVHVVRSKEALIHHKVDCPPRGLSVKGDIVWKSDLEEAAFRRLERLLPSLKLSGLVDTYKGLSLLLRKRQNRGTWDWGVFEDFVTTYELEVSQQERTLEKGLEIIRTSLERTYEVKRRKGKLVDLLEEKWTENDTSHLDKNLGVLGKCFPNLANPQAAIFLMALAIVIVYETKGAFGRRRLRAWLMPSIRKQSEREQIIEDFLTIDGKGSDGKSDFLHLRNGFAHGHFEFIDQRTITIWDVSERNEVYRRRLPIQDLGRLVEISQKKLEMLEVFPYIQIATQSLYKTYKHEWKNFRR